MLGDGNKKKSKFDAGGELSDGLHTHQWKTGTFVTICGEGETVGDVPENGLVIEKESDEEKQLRDMLELYICLKKRRKSTNNNKSAAKTKSKW